MRPIPRAGERLGRYLVGETLGSGGMGVVVAATDPTLQRPVALKVLWPHLVGDPATRERFHREVATLARLDSPHVVTVFDHGEQDGLVYVATQLVPGGDLAGLLARRGPLPAGLALDLCAQVAAALEDAHRAGVVHRDVKPGNVLVQDPDARPLTGYLCDFGIAVAAEASGLTVTGVVTGTWAWLAPERTEGGRGEAVGDLYSLGCVLWACLTGRPPYEGPDVDVALAHVSAPVPRLPGGTVLDERINAILARAMAKRPQDRFRSATEMRRQLLAAAALAGTPEAGRAARRGRRRIVAGVAAGVAAVALALGALVWSGGRGDPTPRADPTTSSSRSVSPSPDAPDGPVTGDLDGDGRGDLEVTSYVTSARTDRLTWHSTGDGWSGAQTDRLTASTRSVVTGRFGGDVASTLAWRQSSAGSGAERLTLTVLGDHATTTTVAAPVALSSKAPTHLAAGDFDGDGDDDLAYATIRGDRLRVWVLLDQDGRFTAPTRWLDLAAPQRYLDELETGDFDGDGHDDLAVGLLPPLAKLRADDQGRLRRTLRLATSDGHRFTAGPETTLRFTWWQVGELAAGDFAGDGTDRLLVSVERSAGLDLEVYAVRDGRFASPVSRGVISALPCCDATTSLTVSDVDGDGRDDLVRVQSQTKVPVRVDTMFSNGSAFRAPAPGPVRRCPSCRDGAVGVYAVDDTSVGYLDQ